MTNGTFAAPGKYSRTLTSTAAPMRFRLSGQEQFWRGWERRRKRSEATDAGEGGGAASDPQEGAPCDLGIPKS